LNAVADSSDSFVLKVRLIPAVHLWLVTPIFAHKVTVVLNLILEMKNAKKD
jgi:hypothetical protein